VNYSTKKIKRQKGTGGARAGSIKSPLFVGGGRVFGPVPRDYSHKLNKKVKALARCSALAQKAKSNNLRVIENLVFDAPKTKEFAKMWQNQQLSGKKLLLVLPEPNHNVFLSSRNLPDVKTLVVNELNTYEIMKANDLLLLEGTVEAINQLWGHGEQFDEQPDVQLGEQQID